MSKKFSFTDVEITAGADLRVWGHAHVPSMAALGLCHTHNKANFRLCIEIMRSSKKNTGRIKHKVYQPCFPIKIFSHYNALTLLTPQVISITIAVYNLFYLPIKSVIVNEMCI